MNADVRTQMTIATLRPGEQGHPVLSNHRTQSATELYKNVLNYDRDRLAGLAGSNIPIEFVLPSNEPATTLIATPPSYWEVEAKGKARGVDYAAVFLVPVYGAS